MRLSFSIEYLVALIGGAIFCTTFYWKVDRMEKDIVLVKKALGLSEIAAPADSTTNRSNVHKSTNP